MIRFVLKLIGTSFLVLWWMLSGLLNKIVGTFMLFLRIKRIFLGQKENSKKGDS
jgi:hypothetical protein